MTILLDEDLAGPLTDNAEMWDQFADRIIPFVPPDQRTDARKEIESIAQACLTELKEAFKHATKTEAQAQ